MELDSYDRVIGALDGLPDVTKTRPATIRYLSPLVGNSQTFIVQTYRQRDKGDTIFLETSEAGKALRIVLPATVADCIARQRDSLTTKVRVKHGKRIAQERAERGERPAFMNATKRKPAPKK